MENEKIVMVGDREFLIYRFSMAEGMVKKAKLLQIVASILSKTSFEIQLTAAGLKKLLDDKIPIDQIGNLMIGFFQSIEPEKIPSLILEFLSKTHLVANGTKLQVTAKTFDAIFDNEKDLFLLLKEVFFLNVGDFSDAKEEIESFLELSGVAKGSQKNNPEDNVASDQKQTATKKQPRIMAR